MSTTIAKGNEALETIEKCLLKVSDLWVRILESIRKTKAAVCGESTRTKKEDGTVWNGIREISSESIVDSQNWGK